MGFSFYHIGWLLVKPGNSTEEKSHFLSLFSISCDLLSWLHNWQSFLVEVTRLTPFWYTRKPFFGKISDCLFLSRLMITFVLRLIPLRKLVLFSFHMLTSPTTCHKKWPTKKRWTVLTFSFCLRFVGKVLKMQRKTGRKPSPIYDLISMLLSNANAAQSRPVFVPFKRSEITQKGRPGRGSDRLCSREKFPKGQKFSVLFFSTIYW